MPSVMTDDASNKAAEILSECVFGGGLTCAPEVESSFHSQLNLYLDF